LRVSDKLPVFGDRDMNCVIADPCYVRRYTYFPGEFSDVRLTWKVDSEMPLLPPHFNIAPSQEAPVFIQPDGTRTIELFQWELMPCWAKGPTVGYKMINACTETLNEKSCFR
jgi:putative SOS response-associated peptidase YedK